MKKGNIIHRWKEPKEVTSYLFRKSIQMGKDVLPRALLIVSIILVLAFLFLNNLAPEEIFRPLARNLILVFLFMCFLLSVGFVNPILDRLFGAKYTITEKKIVKNSIGSPKVIYWRNVTGYSLGGEEEFPDAISITVYSKLKTVLWLPKGELSDQVIATFNQRCPLITESEDDQFSGITINGSDFFHLLVFSLIYTIVAAYIFYAHSSKFAFKVLFFTTMILGPGTLGCLFLYGWKAIKEKTFKRDAIFFNMFAFMLVLFSCILLELHHWSKIIKELGGK